ncbi:MAG: hypothetical protein LBJ95_02615 [Oscillospiraceae bacterium]|jgi:hypothetical protein|nr:hypothetical protein [Oscillospiraceae bacterium]
MKNEIEDFLKELKSKEIEKFFEELERDEQLKRDFSSNLSDREKYEIAKAYFDKLSYRDFRKILNRYLAMNKSAELDSNDDMLLQYVSGGYNNGSLILTYNGIYATDGKGQVKDVHGYECEHPLKNGDKSF